MTAQSAMLQNIAAFKRMLKRAKKSPPETSFTPALCGGLLRSSRGGKRFELNHKPKKKGEYDGKEN